jgi:hypothetical protein
MIPKEKDQVEKKVVNRPCGAFLSSVAKKKGNNWLRSFSFDMTLIFWK